MSSFTWLDYSEHERRQVLQVIDQFGDDETRDELGLGTIRDTFADFLFPGTSTIQTRARYFVFVPWVFQELERRKIPSRQASKQAREVQGKLRNALIEGGEQVGVIGFKAGLNVQRLPSSVYWYGLGRWRVVTFRGSEDDYLRSLDSFYESRADAPREEGESARSPANWHVHLPKPPGDWLSSTTFDLTEAESEYLIERIAHFAPESLLTHLLDSGQSIEDHVAFPWELAFVRELPATLASVLEHARHFSELMHGAALVYNLLLARQQAGGIHVDDYREQLDRWQAERQARWEAHHNWDRASFWQLIDDRQARVRSATRLFVNAWIELVLALPAGGLGESSAAHRMVRNQEHAVKLGRARLGNPRTTENWQGASGAQQLDYRWYRPVRAIVNDILAPQKGQ